MNKVILLFLMMFCSVEVFAEACTYQEALMALENGNVKRAETLMQMAARDGDQRAVSYLSLNSRDYGSKFVSIASTETGKDFISLP